MTKNRAFRKSLSVRRVRSVVGDGLLTIEGEEWLRRRRLSQPAFHRERIEAYGRIMVEHTDRMLGGWSDGQTRDVHADMMALTLGIAAKALFDAEVAEDVATVGRSGAELSRYFERLYSGLRFFVPDWFPTPGNVRRAAAVRKLDAIVFRIMDEHRRTREDRGDLLSMLLYAQDEHGRRLTDAQLRDELMTLMLAGHETTALALSWASYLLALDPERSARLASEIEATLDGRPPSAGDVRRLPYTEGVVLESLRLYPPAYALGREATHDVEIGAHRIRKGTIVLISQWAMHRDGRWFDEPDAFRPERWADGLAKRLPRGVYLPFGAGPRMCIGASFAMLEAELLLARMAQSFTMTLVPRQDVTPQPVTLRPRHGVRVVLTARDPNAARRARSPAAA